MPTPSSPQEQEETPAPPPISGSRRGEPEPPGPGPGAADPAAPPPPSASLADDVERRPEESHLEFVRTICWIVSASISLPFAALALGAALVITQPVWLLALQAAAWLLTTAGLIWWSRTWPALEHHHTSWRLNAERIEIRHGVVWRSVASVPLSRVQHIDVTQGLIERGLDLATLVAHTAGTESATVTLPGLSPATASALRDHLVRGGGDDAV